MKYANEMWGFGHPCENTPGQGSSFATNWTFGGAPGGNQMNRTYGSASQTYLLATPTDPYRVRYEAVAAATGLSADAFVNDCGQANSKHKITAATRVKFTGITNLRFWFGMERNGPNQKRYQAYSPTDSEFVGFVFSNVDQGHTTLHVHSGRSGNSVSIDTGITMEGFDDRIGFVWDREQGVKFVVGRTNNVGNIDFTVDHPLAFPWGDDLGYQYWNIYNAVLWENTIGGQVEVSGLIYRVEL